jgi:hypothetical protein
MAPCQPLQKQNTSLPFGLAPACKENRAPSPARVGFALYLDGKATEAKACTESALTDDDVCTQVETPRSNSAQSSSKASVTDYGEEWAANLSSTFRKVEMDELAIAIACAVQFKAQTCQYSGFKCVRLHPVHEHLRNLFLEFDGDGDGKLTRSEAFVFCRHLNLPSDSGCRFFSLMDGDKTGFVDWEAFLVKYAPLFSIKS